MKFFSKSFLNTCFLFVHCMIARKSALIIAINIINGMLGYAALFFIARYMAPGDYGIIGFALGFVGLFLVLGNLGFDAAHIKRVSEGKELDNCIGTYFFIKLGLAGLFASVTIGAIFFWKYVLNRGFESPTHEIAIYIMLCCFVLETITQVMINTFNARQEIVKSQFPLFFQTLTRVIMTIFVAISGLGVILLALTYLAGEIVLFCSALFFFWGYHIGKPSKTLFKSYAVFAFPLIIATASNIIMSFNDRVLIQLFWTATAVGFYFAAIGLTTFIDMFTTGVGTLLLPNYSELHAKNDILGIQKLVYQSDRYMSMVSFPLVVGMIVLASPAVRILLSDTYLPAIVIFQILPIMALMNALSRPFGYLLMGINRPDLSRNQLVLQLFVNVILNIILIPQDIKVLNLRLLGLGAQGAAISVVIACCVGMLYTRIYAWKLIKAKGNPRILLHLFSAVIMAIMLYWVNSVVFIGRWYELLSVAIVGLGIYVIMLWIFREFTKKDFYFFLDILNIKKMSRYIKEEIISFRKH